MVALAGRVFKRGRNVAGFEHWIIFENLLASGACGQQVKHILDADAQAAQARAPAALIRVDRYAVSFTHDKDPEAKISVYFTKYSTFGQLQA